MNKKNKAFMADPAGWLRNNILSIDTDNTLNHLKMPVIDHFDLVAIGNATDGKPVFDLVHYPAAEHRMFSRPIKAYWLPYKANDTKSLQMRQADNVSFFFTAELSGCRLALSDSASPLVLHVAGDFGTAQRRQQTSDRIPGLHRKYSLTDYEDEDVERQAIVGFKTVGGWQFVTQGKNFSEHVEDPRVQKTKVRWAFARRILQ